MLQWLLCYRSCCRPSFFGPIHAMRFNTGAQCFEPCPLKQWHDSFADSRSSPFEPMICSTVPLSLSPSLFSFPHFANVSPLFSPSFSIPRFSTIGENDFSHRVTKLSKAIRLYIQARHIIIYPRHCSRGWNVSRFLHPTETWKTWGTKSVNLVHTFFTEQSRRLCAVVSGSLSFFLLFSFSFSQIGNWIISLSLDFINFIINFSDSSLLTLKKKLSEIRSILNDLPLRYRNRENLVVPPRERIVAPRRMQDRGKSEASNGTSIDRITRRPVRLFLYGREAVSGM